MAAALRREFASDAEPIDVDLVAEELGCRLRRPRQRNRGSVVEATLRPLASADRFVIEVDPAPRHGWTDLPAAVREALSRHRRRFRVGHELAHTFFFERAAGRGPSRMQAWTAEEERWCDGFANTLLVPQATASCLPAEAKSVFAIQDQFDVSLEVAARALGVAHPQLDVALWFWVAGQELSASSLVHQWSSRTAHPALRRWRDGEIVARTIARTSARGQTLGLRRNRGSLHGTAQLDQQRRQLVMTAGPT
jgi:hypothetical protein